jgi:hypothetical protein
MTLDAASQTAYAATDWGYDPYYGVSAFDVALDWVAPVWTDPVWTTGFITPETFVTQALEPVAPEPLQPEPPPEEASSAALPLANAPLFVPALRPAAPVLTSSNLLIQQEPLASPAANSVLGTTYPPPPAPFDPQDVTLLGVGSPVHNSQNGHAPTHQQTLESLEQDLGVITHEGETNPLANIANSITNRLDSMLNQELVQQEKKTKAAIEQYRKAVTSNADMLKVDRLRKDAEINMEVLKTEDDKAKKAFAEEASTIARGAVIVTATALGGPLGGVAALAVTNGVQVLIEAGHGDAPSLETVSARVVGDSTAIFGGMAGKAVASLPAVTRMAPWAKAVLPKVATASVDGSGSGVVTYVQEINKGTSADEALKRAGVNAVASGIISGGGAWLGESSLAGRVTAALGDKISTAKDSAASFLANAAFLPPVIKNAFTDSVNTTLTETGADAVEAATTQSTQEILKEATKEASGGAVSGSVSDVAKAETGVSGPSAEPSTGPSSPNGTDGPGENSVIPLPPVMELSKPANAESRVLKTAGSRPLSQGRSTLAPLPDGTTSELRSPDLSNPITTFRPSSPVTSHRTVTAPPSGTSSGAPHVPASPSGTGGTGTGGAGGSPPPNNSPSPSGKNLPEEGASNAQQKAERWAQHWRAYTTDASRVPPGITKSPSDTLLTGIGQTIRISANNVEAYQILTRGLPRIKTDVPASTAPKPVQALVKRHADETLEVAAAKSHLEQRYTEQYDILETIFGKEPTTKQLKHHIFGGGRWNIGGTVLNWLGEQIDTLAGVAKDRLTGTRLGKFTHQLGKDWTRIHDDTGRLIQLGLRSTGFETLTSRPALKQVSDFGSKTGRSIADKLELAHTNWQRASVFINTHPVSRTALNVTRNIGAGIATISAPPLLYGAFTGQLRYINTATGHGSEADVGALKQGAGMRPDDRGGAIGVIYGPVEDWHRAAGIAGDIDIPKIQFDTSSPGAFIDSTAKTAESVGAFMKDLFWVKGSPTIEASSTGGALNWSGAEWRLAHVTAFVSTALGPGYHTPDTDIYGKKSQNAVNISWNIPLSLGYNFKNVDLGLLGGAFNTYEALYLANARARWTIRVGSVGASHTDQLNMFGPRLGLWGERTEARLGPQLIPVSRYEFFNFAFKPEIPNPLKVHHENRSKVLTIEKPTLKSDFTAVADRLLQSLPPSEVAPERAFAPSDAARDAALRQMFYDPANTAGLGLTWQEFRGKYWNLVDVDGMNTMDEALTKRYKEQSK